MFSLGACCPVYLIMINDEMIIMINVVNEMIINVFPRAPDVQCT